MGKNKSYRGAACVCCIGCICQAVAANLPPLFFVIFSKIYNLNVSELAVIVLCGFAAQIVSDAFAGMFCDKIGDKNFRNNCAYFYFLWLAFTWGSSGIRLRRFLFIRV